MPLYEYECDACGNRFEKIQKFSDPLVDTCPKCGKGPVRKLMSSPAIQFKGSGWYITDYAKKDGGAKDTKPSGGESTDAKSGDTGKDAKGTDAAKETKTADSPKETKSPAGDGSTKSADAKST
jgi:putative FmdB family regulatory protein